MKRCLKSPTACLLLAVYLALACLLFHEALTCTGWACDLVALPVALPLGLPLAWLFNGLDSLFILPDLSAGLMRKWHFILPTVAANAVFYFWVGRQLEKLIRWLLRGA